MKKAVLKDIHKIFESLSDGSGNVERFTALDGVTLAFTPGEIHTIIGENGAGKSTLVNILSGLHQPSRGCITIGSREFCFTSPSEALSAGIAMVHQRPLLSDEITVLENILLGSSGILLRRKENAREISALEAEWNIAVDLSAPAKSLNAAGKLYTALLGALYRKPDFLILDEPTSVLVSEEKEQFFLAMRKARERALGIILITHKMNEAVRVSDRISVLKQGRLIFSSSVKNPENGIPVTEELLTALINPSPQKAADEKKTGASMRTEGPLFGSACILAGISAKSEKRNPVKDISFTAQSGKITGIFGLPGSGIETLEDILCGMSAPDSGTVTIGNKTFTAREINPSALRKQGLAFVPSDRSFRASHPELSIFDMLTVYRGGRFFLPSFSNQTFVRTLLAEGHIDAHPSRPAGTLSGGQLQRLILARELASKPSVLILAEPEWGLDIRSADALRARLLSEAEKGMTVIILTDTLDSLEDTDFYSSALVLREGTLI